MGKIYFLAIFVFLPSIKAIFSFNSDGSQTIYVLDFSMY